jgi:hypothetical protein
MTLLQKKFLMALALSLKLIKPLNQLLLLKLRMRRVKLFHQKMVLFGSKAINIK